jgi:hypothetical protein
MQRWLYKLRGGNVGHRALCLKVYVFLVALVTRLVMMKVFRVVVNARDPSDVASAKIVIVYSSVHEHVSARIKILFISQKNRGLNYYSCNV